MNGNYGIMCLCMHSLCNNLGLHGPLFMKILLKIVYVRVITQISIWKYFLKCVKRIFILKFINLGGIFVQMNFFTQKQVKWFSESSYSLFLTNCAAVLEIRRQTVLNMYAKQRWMWILRFQWPVYALSIYTVSLSLIVTFPELHLEYSMKNFFTVSQYI
jgi:uncharacterized secreted protein with C-terminal beta-propeller domain